MTTRFGILFPGNDGRSGGGVVDPNPAYTPNIAIEYLHPENNGCPFGGPSGAGWTMLRRIFPFAQTAAGASNGGTANTRYAGQFWLSNISGFVTSGDTWLWNNGVPLSHVGMHYWPPVNTTADWLWEIAAEAGDRTDFNGSGQSIPVTGDMRRWFTQGLRSVKNGDGTYTFTAWPDLPSVANAKKIEYTTLSTNYDVVPPLLGFTIGDSPWSFETGYQHESASCIQGEFMIVAKAMTEADIVIQSANFDKLLVADALNNIWYGKNNFKTIDDLTCDFGTGRSWQWHDSAYKGKLANIGYIGDAVRRRPLTPYAHVFGMAA